MPPSSRDPLPCVFLCGGKVERRRLGIEKAAGRRVEHDFAAMHTAVVARLVEVHAVVADRVADIATGAGPAPRGLRAVGRLLVGIEPQHLLRFLHAHDPGEHHVDDRLDLPGVEQIHRLLFTVPVGGLDVGIEVHLELQARAADQLAVVELDQQALDVSTASEGSRSLNRN